MPKYTKRPVTIEAFQLTLDARRKAETWPDWLEAAFRLPFGDEGAVRASRESATDRQNDLEIVTKEGLVRARIDDWIIRGVQGELYPCKPDIFEATYVGPVAAETEIVAEGLAFGDAIEALREGKCVARRRLEREEHAPVSGGTRVAHSARRRFRRPGAELRPGDLHVHGPGNAPAGLAGQSGRHAGDGLAACRPQLMAGRLNAPRACINCGELLPVLSASTRMRCRKCAPIAARKKRRVTLSVYVAPDAYDRAVAAGEFGKHDLDRRR